MTRFSIFLAGTLSLATALPAAAQSFRAENRVIVNPISSSSFEVIEGGGYGARGMWCAAADYALDVLNAPGTTRIYVQTARGPSTTQPGRKAVVFGLDPAGATPQTTMILGASIRQPGSNLSIDHSYGFCHDARLTNSR